MTVRLSTMEAEERIKRIRSVRGSDRSNFCALVERTGIDPARDLRFGNFSDVDFGNCNLHGYDFTGSALYGCSFRNARIVGAKFAQCEFSYLDGDDKLNRHAAEAIDWNEAYRLADTADLKVPEMFDKHINAGTFFRDFEFAPLMRCVELAQTSGIAVKLAIAASNTEVSQCRHRWEAFDHNRPNRMRDYVDSLNRDLGFGDYFKYDIVNLTWAAHEAGKGAVMPVHISERTARDGSYRFHESVSLLIHSGALHGGNLVRRMRSQGSKLSRDFDGRY